MKKSTKTVIAVIAFVLVLAGVLLLWRMNDPMNDAHEGEKEISLTVIHGDGSEKELELHTELDTLGGVLLQEGVIVGSEGEFGLYVTAVDGETADAGEEQWWSFCDADGDMLQTGVDMTPISDGDTFLAILETGYEAFG